MDLFLTEFLDQAKNLLLGNLGIAAIVLGVSLFVALTMRGLGQLLGASVFAFILLVVAIVVRDTATGATPQDPQAYLTGLDGALNDLMTGNGGFIITTTAVFAVLLIVLTLLKGILFRGE